jgi:hypothetical protein
MENSQREPTPERWHVDRWPPLAWWEMAIKLAAIPVGIVAFVQALSAGTFGLPGGLRLVQLVILAFLSLGLVAAIFDRLVEREVVAMVFVILNNTGHWGMVVALATQPGPGWLLVAFAGLMLAGDVVKLEFLRVHDFTARNTPPAVLFGLTSLYVVGYLIILMLEVLR